MATNLISRCRPMLTRTAITDCIKLTSSPSIPTFIQSREYRPYSKIPEKFQKKVDRHKKNRDDVYLHEEQVLPTHTLDEAVDCMRAYSLFGPEPIDLLLEVNMGEGKNAIGALKGLVFLPKPIVEAQTVLVFAEGELAEEARAAGASIVGGVELIPQIEQGELQFDHCLSTLDFLPKIKHLPKYLRNKMPNARRGTATDDIVSALKLYSSGETYLADRNGHIRHTVAMTNFSNDEIRGNMDEFIQTVDQHKTVARGDFFISAGLVIPPGPKLDLTKNDVIPL